MKVLSRQNSLQQSNISKNQNQFKTPIKKSKNYIERTLSTNFQRTNSSTQNKSFENSSTTFKINNQIKQIYSNRCLKSPLTKSCFTKLRKIRSIKQIQEYKRRQSIQRYSFKQAQKSQKSSKQIQFPKSDSKFVKNMENYSCNTGFVSANAIMHKKIKKNKKDKVAVNIFAQQDFIQKSDTSFSQNSYIVCTQ